VAWLNSDSIADSSRSMASAFISGEMKNCANMSSAFSRFSGPTSNV
jgi:hypothetical protein